ncbi:hypothetical protein DPMN_176886 [Dreissena polymorpha]|uniref:Uncharacterized protein n=1 Tax=Dreissena polymorpha TaxID=45954 RepID=A0A9D4E9Y7_DREPO|nr:hypothetical protein DPMN_176886 [Dreissena polymorpha]
MRDCGRRSHIAAVDTQRQRACKSKDKPEKSATRPSPTSSNFVCVTCNKDCHPRICDSRRCLKM